MIASFILTLLLVAALFGLMMAALFCPEALMVILGLATFIGAWYLVHTAIT